MESQAGFLSPYRVLDISDERGLMAGHLLARLGAEVIQVEPPQGAASRAFGGGHEWYAYAAGKRSITCSLDQQQGRELFHRLLESADVFIESAGPGKMADYGLSCAELMSRYPNLVYVSISAFGSKGTKSTYAATDLTLWAAGGALLPARHDQRPPLRISVPQAYRHAAADAAAGAVMALLARRLSGRGQHVDVSAQQSVAQATLSGVLAAAVGHDEFALRPVSNKQGLGSKLSRSKWPVRDGMVELHLGMGAATGRFTNNLFAWMHAEGACHAELSAWDWVTIPSKIEADEISPEELTLAHDLVECFLASRSKAELVEAAIHRKLLLAPVNTVGDLLQSPQLKERGFWCEVTSDHGMRHLLPRGLAAISDYVFPAATAAPALGESNGVLYDRLGIPEAELVRLQTQGVI